MTSSRKEVIGGLLLVLLIAYIVGGALVAVFTAQQHIVPDPDIGYPRDFIR